MVVSTVRHNMAVTNAAAGFIGASVTLVLVIVFMILLVVLVKQCLQYRAKRKALRERQAQQQQIIAQHQRRRGSVTEAVPATFDWHHSIRVEGTPPPSYGEAEKLPSIQETSKKKPKQKDQTNGTSGPSTADSRGKTPLIRIESSFELVESTGQSVNQATMTKVQANGSHDWQEQAQLSQEGSDSANGSRFSSQYTQYSAASNVT